jgi:hypothetical protein
MLRRTSGKWSLWIDDITRTSLGEQNLAAWRFYRKKTVIHV